MAGFRGLDRKPAGAAPTGAAKNVAIAITCVMTASG
jgi:hypothetical protein